MPDPLEYGKPNRDPGWFNVLCALGCVLALLAIAIVILDRFGMTPQSLLHRVLP